MYICKREQFRNHTFIHRHWRGRIRSQRMWRRTAVLFSLFLLCTFPAQFLPAETAREAELNPTKRPTVALVLASGGALGFAHIGVIDVLEELDIPIDLVVGSSMGSVVGGLYSVGYTSTQMESLAKQVEWTKLFIGNTPRRYRSYYERQSELNYVADIEIDRSGIRLSQGLTQASQVELLLSSLTLNFSHINDFEEFPRRFRAVATNLKDGEQRVLSSGLLSEVMRASIAIPGVLTPQVIAGESLVDGGLAKRLPVDVARELGADIVIAVDLVKNLQDPQQISNPMEVFYQSIRFALDQDIQKQYAQADVVILPDLENLSAANFTRAEAFIERGKKAARASKGELTALIEEYKLYQYDTREMSNPLSNVDIRDLEVSGSNALTKREVRRITGLGPGIELSPREIGERINRIYGTGRIQAIRFHLSDPTEEGSLLHIELTDRDKGIHNLQFGYRFQSQSSRYDPSQFVFLTNLTFRELTGPGSRWSTDLYLVDEIILHTEYFQPIGSVFFVAPYGFLTNDQRSYYEGSQLVAEYSDFINFVGLRTGFHIWRLGEVFAGFEGAYIDSSLENPDEDAEDTQFQSFESFLPRYRLALHTDNLDRFPFPQDGGIAQLEWRGSFEEIGSPYMFQKLALHSRYYITAGDRHTLAIDVFAGTDFNTGLKPYQYFQLGGQHSFLGYFNEELFGTHVAALQMGYRFKLFSNLTQLEETVYLRLIGNIGNTWMKPVESIVKDPQFRLAGSIGLAVNTFIGAAFFDVGLNSELRPIVYFSLGRSNQWRRFFY